MLRQHGRPWAVPLFAALGMVLTFALIWQVSYTRPRLSSSDAPSIVSLQQNSSSQQQGFCDSDPLDMPPTRVVDLGRGAKLHVYQNADIVSQNLKEGERQWEEFERQQVLMAMSVYMPPEVAPARRMFVDVGANIGSFTMTVASFGFDVVAFEGMLSNQRLLRTSMCDSAARVTQHVTLHPYGLGNKPTSCILVSDVNNVGDGITRCDVSIEEFSQPGYRIRGVMQIKMMDDVLQHDVQVLKVDVEGFEPFVLQGAHRLLTKHTVWFLLLEYDTEQLRSVGAQNTADYVVELTRLGYSVSRTGFRGPFMDKAAVSALGNERNLNTNLYFVHRHFESRWWSQPPIKATPIRRVLNSKTSAFDQ